MTKCVFDGCNNKNISLFIEIQDSNHENALMG